MMSWQVIEAGPGWDCSLYPATCTQAAQE